MPWLAANNVVPGYSDLGNNINANGDCSSRYVDGGSIGAGWANKSALSGWTAAGSNAGFTPGAPYPIPGFANKASCSLHGGNAPTIWGRDRADTDDQAYGDRGLFTNNQGSTVSGGYYLYSNGTTFFRNTFDVTAQQLADLKKTGSLLAFYAQADDWMQVYVNGALIENKTSHASNTGTESSISFSPTLLNAGPNVIAIQVADKALWLHTATGNGSRGSGICYNITGDLLSGPSISHKIFNINAVGNIPFAVRDNETFPFNLLSYMFPDTGIKGVAGAFHLWLSGVYDNAPGRSSSDSSQNASLNAITSFNNKAEIGCTPLTASLCRNSVPLAYVPQDDGSGNAGNTTPNGNIWLSLRQTNYGGADPYKGGIASTVNSNIGGYSGVHLNTVEISKIRVSVTGITTDANNSGASYGQSVQGKLPYASSLQVDARNLNLPTDSQGPGGPAIWDNVRKPIPLSTYYSPNQTATSLDFPSPDPGIFGSPISKAVGQQYFNGKATSLLQDGQGGGYHNPSEPLTLTAGVTAVSDVKLKWDEYVDWSQVDDKGHWYPTSSGVSTGFDFGAYTPGHYEALHYLYGGNLGSPVYQGTITSYYCYNPTTWAYTGSGSTWGSVPAGCYGYLWDPIYDANKSCQSTGPTNAANKYHYPSWSTPNNESQFGWYNSAKTNGGNIPTGGNGSSASSAFGPNPSINPAWSKTGNTAYWQDPIITAMSASGATTPPTQSPQWIYNKSDPLYNGRMIFDGSTQPIKYSYGYTTWGSDTQCYYTAAGSLGRPYYVGTTYQYIQGYYANAHYLYENSVNPVNPADNSRWGSTATFDGRTDGSVMTGWAWSSNPQRVRYENTWKDHSRDLGPRSITGSEASDDLLYGPDFDGSASQPARGSSTIYNPAISGANGDIFSGGSISGYFSNNTLNGAYLFANNTISNFGSNGSYSGYFNNPSARSGTTYGPATPDALHHIFPNFNTTIGLASATLPATSGNINLNKTIYRVSGDLTLSAAQFCNGAGTIYVDGDLTINGNLSYCASATSKADLPSVGFVVTGKITVAPGVTSIVGAYVTNGSFTTVSSLLTSNRNAITGDVPFTLNGSVIASSYDLRRQLGALQLLGGQKTETFNYDGRIVVSPPPGFNSLNGTVQAVLNEAVPRN